MLQNQTLQSLLVQDLSCNCLFYKLRRCIRWFRPLCVQKPLAVTPSPPLAQPATMSSKAATDLLELVDWKSTECLNESPEHTLQNVLKQVRTAFATALADSASSGPVHSLNAASIALCACSVLRMVPVCAATHRGLHVQEQLVTSRWGVISSV